MAGNPARDRIPAFGILRLICVKKRKIGVQICAVFSHDSLQDVVKFIRGRLPFEFAEGLSKATVVEQR